MRFDPTKPITFSIENPYWGDYPEAHTAIVRLLINYGAAQELLYETLPRTHKRKQKQSSFSRDIQAARKLPSRKKTEVRQELGQIDHLHNRCSWIRNAIVHGDIVSMEMELQPEAQSPEGNSWAPSGRGTYVIKSKDVTIRLDDSTRLNQAAEEAKQLLLAVRRFRNLVS